MKLKTLGNSDLQLTPIGLGAWAMGGPWEAGWSNQDDSDSIAAIHRALELGINWIDTAAVYGLGHSEEVIGKALDQWSGTHPYVFTKCTGVWDKAGKLSYVYTEESIRQEVEASLQRLNTDVIDLYQVHWAADTISETLEAWTALAKLKQEGKVRHIGVSNFTLEELQKAAEIAPITSLQPAYSLLDRSIETEILPYAKANNIGILNYSPMGSGLFTGAMTRDRIANLANDDWRKKSSNFQEPKLTTHLAIADRLKEVGAKHNQSPGATAIAWTQRHSTITASIVGARSPKQIEGIIGVIDYTLTPEEALYIESGE